MVNDGPLIPTQTKVHMCAATLPGSERASATFPSCDLGGLAADSAAFLNQMTRLSLMAEFSALSIGSIAIASAGPLC